MRVAYLVHDLNDPAAARRVRMLSAGGAEVSLLGFHRGAGAPAEVSGALAKSLGLTQDGRMLSRAASVVLAILKRGRASAVTRKADVVVARNLETLVIAAAVRGSKARLVYECLDVHRMMLARGVTGRLLRALERALLSRVSLLIVSSPAFLKAYFEPRQGYAGEAFLLENKALDLDERVGVRLPATPARRPSAPPWRIGWFGAIRCHRSLALLMELTRRFGGRLEVQIAGRPAYDQFDGFERIVEKAPFMSFTGPYSAQDLRSLYESVHFTWAIDFFEEGLNSAWLLPNRLYEGGLFGSVPIALSDVETGRWLKDRHAGLLVSDPLADLSEAIAAMTSERYAGLSAASAAIPLADLRATRADCTALVQRLATLA